MKTNRVAAISKTTLPTAAMLRLRRALAPPGKELPLHISIGSALDARLIQKQLLPQLGG